MRENPHHRTNPGNGVSLDQLMQKLGGTPVKIQAGTSPINPLDRAWPVDWLDYMIWSQIGGGKSTTKLKEFPVGIRVHRQTENDG